MGSEELKRSFTKCIFEPVPRGFDRYFSQNQFEKEYNIVRLALENDCMAYFPQASMFFKGGTLREVQLEEIKDNPEWDLERPALVLSDKEISELASRICVDARWVCNSSFESLERDAAIVMSKEKRFSHWSESRVVDPKQHIILERYGSDALIFVPENTYTPYVVAHSYNPQSGEWWHGDYFANLSDAHNCIDPNVLYDSCVIPTKQHLLNLLQQAGFEPSESNLNEVFFNNDSAEFNLASELNKKLTEVMKSYIHNAKDFLIPLPTEREAVKTPMKLSDKDTLLTDAQKNLPNNKERPQHIVDHVR